MQSRSALSGPDSPTWSGLRNRLLPALPPLASNHVKVLVLQTPPHPVVSPTFKFCVLSTGWNVNPSRLAGVKLQQPHLDV